MAETATPSEPGSRFMLDKRLPIAGLVAILLQFGGFVWYASAQNARVDQLEVDRSALQTRAANMEVATKDLGVIQYRLQAVEATTGRIEAKVDQLREQR